MAVDASPRRGGAEGGAAAAAEEEGREVYTDLPVTAEQRKQLSKLVSSFFEALCALVQSEQGVLRGMEREIARITAQRGEVGEDVTGGYEKSRRGLEQLLRNTNALAEALDRPPVVLPEDEHTTHVAGGGDSSVGGAGGAGADGGKREAEPLPLWDDDETRVFYEDLPDLKLFVPAVLLGDGGGKGGKGSGDGEEKESEEGEGKEEKEKEKETETDKEKGKEKGKEKDKEEKGKDKDKGKEKEKEKEGEKEKEKVKGVEAAKLDDLLQRLPSCVSRDLIDQLAVSQPGLPPSLSACSPSSPRPLCSSLAACLASQRRLLWSLRRVLEASIRAAFLAASLSHHPFPLLSPHSPLTLPTLSPHSPHRLPFLFPHSPPLTPPISPLLLPHPSLSPLFHPSCQMDFCNVSSKASRCWLVWYKASIRTFSCLLPLSLLPHFSPSLPFSSLPPPPPPCQENFCYVNSKARRCRLVCKASRRRLVRALFGVHRTALQLLPYHARLAATLGQYMRDVGPALVHLLEEEFAALKSKKDQINIESKMRNIRFLGELAKFKVAPPSLIFSCLKSCLEDFSHHSIDVACALLETCGAFLSRHPDTKVRMGNMLDIIQRLKNARSFALFVPVGR
ncbi:unnamed protein product [Closterium sp. NIES-54]